MKKEKQKESEIPSYQEFCEWKRCQLCNEKKSIFISKIQRYDIWIIHHNETKTNILKDKKKKEILPFFSFNALLRYNYKK